MKNLFRASALTAVILIASSAQSSAGNITFTLNDVSLKQGTQEAGTLSGWFVLDPTLTILVDFELISSSTGTLTSGFSFAETEYISGTSGTTAYIDHLPDYFRLNVGGTNQLELRFAGGLASTGTFTIDTSSYEDYWLAGTRKVATGTVTASGGAVPEPSSVAMAAIALGAGGLLARRRRAAA